MFGVFHHQVMNEAMAIHTGTKQADRVCKVGKMIDWVGRAPDQQAYLVVVGHSSALEYIVVTISKTWPQSAICKDHPIMLPLFTFCSLNTSLIELATMMSFLKSRVMHDPRRFVATTYLTSRQTQTNGIYFPETCGSTSLFHSVLISAGRPYVWSCDFLAAMLYFPPPQTPPTRL